MYVSDSNEIEQHEEISDSEIEIDINHVQTEIDQINNEVNSISFSNPISISNTNRFQTETVNFGNDENQMYDLTIGEPTTDLKIRLGTSELPRFSCACHKLNICLRNAIARHSLAQKLRILNSSNAHIRRSIQLNSTFRKNKSRLRLENLTRWSSAYLMLESVKRAYDRNLFDSNDVDLACPVDLQTIETYLQILKPSYLLSVSLQSNFSSIADVIPGKNSHSVILL